MWIERIELYRMKRGQSVKKTDISLFFRDEPVCGEEKMKEVFSDLC